MGKNEQYRQSPGVEAIEVIKRWNALVTKTKAKARARQIEERMLTKGY